MLSHERQIGSGRMLGCPGFQEYITYPYSTAHQVLQWLPTKLAECISTNLGDELNVTAKQGASDLWTAAAELNAVITGKFQVVGGPYSHIHTFSCVCV